LPQRHFTKNTLLAGNGEQMSPPVILVSYWLEAFLQIFPVQAANLNIWGHGSEETRRFPL
jgi:hypothetical protein